MWNTTNYNTGRTGTGIPAFKSFQSTSSEILKRKMKNLKYLSLAAFLFLTSCSKDILDRPPQTSI
jgi:hypothetical protein